MPTQEPILTRAFTRLTCSQLLQALGYSSMPLLPVYLNSVGASRTEIGMVMATASIGGLLFRPLIGFSLDYWGRKPTLVTGTCVMAGSMMLIGFVQNAGPLIYVARFLFGVGGGALFTGYFAFASDIVPASRRTEGLALFGIAGLLPLAINPVLGGLSFPPNQLRFYFPLLSIIILLSLVLLFRVEEVKTTLRAPLPSLRFITRALTHKSLLPVWLATIIFATLVTVYMAYATVTAEARGIEQPPLLWLTYGSGAVGIRLLGSRLPDRVGPHNVLTPAISAYILAFVLASHTQTLQGFMAAGLLAGFGHGLCFPVLASQVVTRSPSVLRGSALSMFTALWEASGLLLVPLFGTLADNAGDALMFSSVSVLAIAGLGLWALLEQVVENH